MPLSHIDLSLSLPLFLKAMKKMSSGEDKNKHTHIFLYGRGNIQGGKINNQEQNINASPLKSTILNIKRFIN